MKKASLLFIIILLAPALIIVACQQEPDYVLPKTGKPIPKDAKLVCVFFDDGWLNQYFVALPILLTHNFKATFGIITGYLNAGTGIFKYMSKKEIEELARYGMDVASHSETHPHLTANLTDEQLRKEIIDSKKYLDTMGTNARTFVYPFYEWNQEVIRYVKEAGYLCARGDASKWNQVFDLRTTAKDIDAKYHIPSFDIVRQNLDEFKKIVSRAKHATIICLTYHFISDEGPKETSTPVANFAEQMRYLKEAGFTVVVLPDLF